MFWQIFISMSIIVAPAIMLFYIFVIINQSLVREGRIQQTCESLVSQDVIGFDVEE